MHQVLQVMWKMLEKQPRSRLGLLAQATQADQVTSTSVGLRYVPPSKKC